MSPESMYACMSVLVYILHRTKYTRPTGMPFSNFFIEFCRNSPATKPPERGRAVASDGHSSGGVLTALVSMHTYVHQIEGYPWTDMI